MVLKPHRLAFSLIELSVVILVVGILIAGILQGSKIATKMRLQTAQSLTNSSPVNGIKDLALWLETTSSNSFDSTIDASNSSANLVTKWYDISPYAVRNHAVSAGGSQRPTLTENAINGLPALSFDGSDSFSNTGFYTTSNISIFVVANNLRGSAGYKRIICGYNENVFWFGTRNPQLFAAFYGDSTAWDLALYFNASTNITTTVSVFTSVLSGTSNSGYVNRTLVGTNNLAYTKASGPYGYVIGSSYNGVQFWNGYIGEIIIINRAVKDEERKAIESYLIQKWGIVA